MKTYDQKYENNMKRGPPAAASRRRPSQAAAPPRAGHRKYEQKYEEHMKENMSKNRYVLCRLPVQAGPRGCAAAAGPVTMDPGQVGHAQAAAQAGPGPKLILGRPA